MQEAPAILTVHVDNFRVPTIWAESRDSVDHLPARRQLARSLYAIRVSLCRASRAYSTSPITSLAVMEA